MLKKAKKRLKGGVVFQFQFTVAVKSVEFTVADKKWQPGKLHVEWKRNARIASTQGVHVDLNYGGPNVVNFQNEELTMIGKLSKDGDIYAPKEYKISLEDIRDKKSKKTLASVDLNFSQFAGLTGATYERILPLDVLSTKISDATVRLSITSRFLSQGIDDDDNMSMMSTGSSMQPESTRGDSSDSDRESTKGDKKEHPTSKEDKRDQQIQELLEKIKFLEFDLSNAYAAKQKEKDDAEKEVLLMQTKVAIEAERHQITIENLTTARDEAEKELTELKAKTEKAAAQHAEQVDALRKELVMARIASAEAGNDALSEKLKQAHNESEAKISEMKAAHEKEIAQVKLELEALKKTQASKDEELEKVKKELSTKEAALKDQQVANEKLNVEISRANQQIATTKQESDKIRSEHSKTIVEQTKTIAELRAALELAESKAAAQSQEFLQELDQGGEKEKQAQQFLKEKDSKIAELEKKFQELTEQSEILAVELHETQVLRSTNDQLERKCTKLEEDLNIKESELERLTQENAEQNSQQTVTLLESQVAELEHELKTVSSDLGGKIAELQGLVSSLRQENKEEAMAHSRDLTKLKHENEELKEELAELQKELDGVTTKAKEQKSNSDDSSKVEELRTLLKNAQNDYSEFRKKYERLSNMYEAQEKVIEEMRLATPKPAEPSRSDDIENLKNQNIKMSEELHDVTSQLIEAKMALAEGEFQFERMKQAKKEAIKQLAAEKLKIVELRKKLTQFEVKHATK